MAFSDQYCINQLMYMAAEIPRCSLISICSIDFNFFEISRYLYPFMLRNSQVPQCVLAAIHIDFLIPFIECV